jgi:hypothetical protein
MYQGPMLPNPNTNPAEFTEQFRTYRQTRYNFLYDESDLRIQWGGMSVMACQHPGVQYVLKEVRANGNLSVLGEYVLPDDGGNININVSFQYGSGTVVEDHPILFNGYIETRLNQFLRYRADFNEVERDFNDYLRGELSNTVLDGHEDWYIFYLMHQIDMEDVVRHLRITTSNEIVAPFRYYYDNCDWPPPVNPPAEE